MQSSNSISNNGFYNGLNVCLLCHSHADLILLSHNIDSLTLFSNVSYMAMLQLLHNDRPRTKIIMIIIIDIAHHVCRSYIHYNSTSDRWYFHKTICFIIFFHLSSGTSFQCHIRKLQWLFNKRTKVGSHSRDEILYGSVNSPLLLL